MDVKNLQGQMPLDLAREYFPASHEMVMYLEEAYSILHSPIALQPLFDTDSRVATQDKSIMIMYTHEGDEIFHRFPPIAKFAEPSQDSPVWFQILFAMLAKYPTIVGAESCLTLLQLMCGSLSRMQEFGEAQAWIVLCLQRGRF